MNQLLEAVERIAAEAGAAILDIYDTDFAVESKADASPLTAADLAADRLVSQGLSSLNPAYPILSEEGRQAPFAERSRWSRYWLVDPLDGTQEFVKKNGEFTVNIALVEDGAPILGVVLAPALGRAYAAARGLGAFVRDGDGRRPIRTGRVAGPPRLIASRSHRNDALQALLDRLPAHHTEFCGSSLKFCRVAEGLADLYPRTGPTFEWDTAAGQCIAEQAGAEVLSLPDLKPLRYNRGESLLNPGFVVFGDRGFGWPQRLLAAL